MTIRPVGGAQPAPAGGPEENVPALAKQLQDPVQTLANSFTQLVADPLLAQDKQFLNTVAEAVQKMDQLIVQVQNLP